jgi:ABC-type branched-subunit amino acid transport system substrate-binding protein
MPRKAADAIAWDAWGLLEAAMAKDTRSCAAGKSSPQQCHRLRPLLTAVAVAAFQALPTSSVLAAEIVIPVAGPAVGQQAARVEAMRTGARKAADAFNAASGIKGERVRVECADDGCDAATAKALAEDLARTKVDLVLGHPCGAAGVAAAAVYGAAGTLFIATASRHASARRPPSAATVFTLAGRDDYQGVEAAEFLAANFKGRTMRSCMTGRAPTTESQRPPPPRSCACRPARR